MKDWIKILFNLLLFFACGMINYYMFKSDGAFLGGFMGSITMVMKDWLLKLPKICTTLNRNERI